jgi:hypothetical protein
MPYRRPFEPPIGRSWSRQKIAQRRPAAPASEWPARASEADRQCSRGSTTAKSAIVQSAMLQSLPTAAAKATGKAAANIAPI